VTVQQWGRFDLAQSKSKMGNYAQRNSHRTSFLLPPVDFQHANAKYAMLLNKNVKHIYRTDAHTRQPDRVLRIAAWWGCEHALVNTTLMCSSCNDFTRLAYRPNYFHCAERLRPLQRDSPRRNGITIPTQGRATVLQKYTLRNHGVLSQNIWRFLPTHYTRNY
jgi:hypothetical protein